MDYAAYYKNCLLYLACVDIAVDLTPDERLQRSRELGIASLLGETIYNFGELVSPFLPSHVQRSDAARTAYPPDYDCTRWDPARMD